jgi:hypothetical protein
MTGRAPPRRPLGRLVRSALLAAALVLTTLVAASARAAAPLDSRVEALLRAFPDGMTPEQLDAVLTVMDEGEVRAALRARLLTDLQASTGSPAAPSVGLLLRDYQLTASSCAYSCS